MDMGDLLAEMFGMGRGPGRGGTRKSPDEEQKYECSLQDFYLGKSVKFASTKQVICPTCKGSGGKEKAKARECSLCNGQGRRGLSLKSQISTHSTDCEWLGMRSVLQPMGPIIQQTSVKCGNCNGVGRLYEAKDRCKKCKGNRTIEERKQLELYIPPGSKEGDMIRLEGEADQAPDQEPGDIVFHLVESEHDVFRRAGADLSADMDITLGEALCGFSRVVLKHLDGRGISITHPRQPGEFLRPGQTIKIAGEGMPIKRREARGDLFLTVVIEFPPDGTLDADTLATLQRILPEPEFPEIEADVVDEATYDADASIDDFGGAEGEWVDDEDGEGADGPQCRQQ